MQSFAANVAAEARASRTDQTPESL